MKDIEKEIKKGEYLKAYEKLEETRFLYTFEEWEKYFKKLKSKDIFCFMMYVLSKKESPEIYYSICELIFYNPFFNEYYFLIKWYVYQCINQFPEYKPILQWTIIMFKDFPDSPFSKEELKEIDKLCRNTNL